MDTFWTKGKEEEVYLTFHDPKPNPSPNPNPSPDSGNGDDGGGDE
jgi:hypothetical protein